MHLLNIQTLKLKEFHGVQPLPYAILSHRWGSEELNFEDVRQNQINKELQGYQKLLGACRIAAKYNVDYLWIDTCCIDKKSSAELSEAINSMYSWYEKAEICLAYLEDVKYDTDIDKSFSKSVWFTRSWTLQELLAPMQVDFYDAKWELIGDRGSKADVIQARTGIQDHILTKKVELWAIGIAERMSWASDRQATRPEDVAYSLMGIFDVNMPLLYGEGEKAFLRLQEEIIRRAREPSFLLWGLDSIALNLFASSPADFSDFKQRGTYCAQLLRSFNLTNVGLEIEATLVRYDLDIYGIVVAATADEENVQYAVLLRELPILHVFYRVGLVQVSSQAETKTKRITILRGTPEQQEALAEEITSYEGLPTLQYAMRIRSNLSFPILAVEHFEAETAWWQETKASWYKYNELTDLKCAFYDPTSPGIARMKCKLGESKTLWFELSFDFESRPCLLIRENPGRVKSYKQLMLPSVYRLSDVVLDEAKVVGFHTFQREVKMWDVVDEASGSVSYFFRSSILDHFAQIPTELTSIENPIWVRFILSWQDEAGSNSWVLLLSSTRPLDKHNILAPVDQRQQNR